VRNAAFKSLGPFIYSLEEDIVTEELLNSFTSIPSLSNALVDNEVNYFCAYSFPAVTLRVSSRWDQLKPTYLELCKDNKFKVRRTLSYSIHEIAAIIGTELTEKDLIPMFDMFTKDLEDVRMGVISNLCAFLSHLSRDTSRLLYIPLLKEIFRESDTNWRFRVLLADQLPLLPDLFSEDILALQIVPILLGLCRDRFSEVRKVAVKSVGVFLERLKEHASFEEIVAEVLGFASSSSFLERLLYIQICLHIPSSLLTENLVLMLCRLGVDPVLNVRIALARSLSHFKEASQSPLIDAVYFLLHQEASSDIGYFMQETPKYTGTVLEAKGLLVPL